MNYIIFGASKYGQIAYERLKSEQSFSIVGFCDNSPQKQGTVFCGLPVISPAQLGDREVIIASMFVVEIGLQLVQLDIKKFYVAFAVKNSIECSLIDLSGYLDLSIQEKKICFVCENNAGSNSYAMWKNRPRDNAEFEYVLVDERSKDSNYFYHIFTSRTIIRTHEGSNIEGRNNIQLWHGIGLKPLGYMSHLTSGAGEERHKNWVKLKAIFSYSQMYNLILSACYGVPIEKFHVVGAPRNDFLFQSDGRAKLKEILMIDSEKKWILYAPTYKEDAFGLKTGKKNAYLHLMDSADMEEFDDFLGKNSCVLVLKLHPFDVEDVANNFENIENILILRDDLLADHKLDFYEVLNGFDMLISDYSSIYSDYLLLNRPILFLTADVDIYEEQAGLLLKPYDFWTPGPKATNFLEVRQAITAFVAGEDEFKDRRKEIASVFHEYMDGDSAKRSFAELAKLLR